MHSSPVTNPNNESQEITHFLEKYLNCRELTFDFKSLLDRIQACIIKYSNIKDSKNSWDSEKTKAILKSIKELMTDENFRALLDIQSSNHKETKEQFLNLLRFMATNDEWVEIKDVIFKIFVGLVLFVEITALITSIVYLGLLSPALLVSLTPFILSFLTVLPYLMFYQFIGLEKLNPYSSDVKNINTDKFFFNGIIDVNKSQGLFQNSSSYDTSFPTKIVP